MRQIVDRVGTILSLFSFDCPEWGVAVIVERMQASVAAHLLMYRVGLRIPAHCSACGKVLLASRPRSEVDRMFGDAELVKLTPATIGDPAALRTELERVRQRGLAYDREEIVPGLSCVAAPIRDDGGRVIAAISVSVPTYRFIGEEAAFDRLISEAGRRISRRLGYGEAGVVAQRPPVVGASAPAAARISPRDPLRQKGQHT